MTKWNKNLGWLAILCLAGQCLAVEKPVDTDDLFAQPKVWQFKIELPAASVESLKSDPKKYVRATLKEGSGVLADVGLRLKGNAAFEGFEKKPSLTLKFNEFVSGEKFHGQGKLFLEDAHQDATYLCAALGGEIFRSVTVPAPRVTWARVELNGKDAGLYVVSEAINRDFLAQYFKKSKGNLYEGANGDINDKLAKDGGDASKDQGDLKALVAACRDQDQAQRLKKVGGLLDVDRFITFAAVEDFLWNSSGYSMGRNNYRVYHDPNSNLITFIPHGLEHLFGNTKGPLLPEWKGLVARNIVDTVEGRRRYREQMAKLLAGPAKPDALSTRINDLAGRIRPAIARESSSDVKSFDAAVALLKARSAQRAKFLMDELAKPEASVPAKP